MIEAETGRRGAARLGRPPAVLAVALTLVVAVAFPASGAAQSPDTWISGWGGVYMDPGTVRDGETGTVWDFGTSFAAGASIQHRFAGTLVAGVELGYSPIRHEVRDATTGLVRDEGRAHLLTPMLVGRVGAIGGSGFRTYITGGAGAMIYGIPELDRWDPDVALRAGGGAEYGLSPRVALFLEWNRWWVFHQAEGVDDNTVRHSHLEIGARYGL